VRAVLAPALVLVAIAASGCGADTDAAARASAECNSALHDELGLSENETGPRTRTQVTGDDERRQLAGVWTHVEVGEGSFSCTVVPDADDELRGLRVAALAVRYD
jgi:hypothetical protein